MKSRRIKGERLQEAIGGWLFSMPAVILFAVFVLYPVVSVFYYSFTNMSGLERPDFIGLENFRNILSDKIFYTTISNNFKFLIWGVPLWTFFPLFIAGLLFEKVRGWKFFRSVYFFPSVLSTVVIGAVFHSLFNNRGLFNELLRGVGLGFLALDWWSRGNLAIPVIAVVINWVGFGYTMLIFLAGMGNISDSVIEAGYLDGANWLQRFIHIILPEMKRLVQLVIIMNIMYCFTSLFTYVLVMTKGGPGYETTVIEYLIYQRAFASQKMGYASALSVMLAFVVSSISAGQFLLIDRKRRMTT